MAKLLMSAHGFDGTIDLMNDRVVISRTGVFNMMKYGLNASREIPIAAISEIIYKPPIMLGMGSIEFVRSGRSTDEKKKNNESRVRFKKLKQHEFKKLKEKVFEMVNEQTHHIS